ncbi:SPOSA6832_00198, partial [Sporobolomyces salmonicolor]
MSHATAHLFQHVRPAASSVASSTSAATSSSRKSAVPAFYLNKVIETYAAKSSTPISLSSMINFGKYGRNKGEKEEADTLVKSGNFLRTELPTRLSHRLRDLQELPFVVASHPRMEHVYELYLEAFDGIRRFPPIKDLDDNDRFCSFMQGTLDKHRVVIPELAIGVSETSPLHLPPAALDRIMLRMLRSRISRRVITEQHIALTSQFRERQRRKGKEKATAEEETRVGSVDTKLNAADVVEPRSFMLFELIKNAVHATVSAHGSSAPLHPTFVTITHGPRDLAIRVSDQGGGIPPYGGLPPDPSDLSSVLSSNPLLPSSPTIGAPLSAQRLDIFSFSHMRRFYQHHAALAAAEPPAPAPSSPSAGALEPSSSSSFPSASLPPSSSSPASDLKGIMALRALGSTGLAGTVSEQLARPASALLDFDAPQMRSGIGLPLSKMYAEYFAGALEIFTVQGWGSDALLRIPKFGLAA